MSSYAFFVQTCREEHKKKHPDASVNFSEFSKKCSERWKTMSSKEKGKFEDMAKADKLRYEKEMKNYVPPKGETKKKFKDPNAPKRPPSAFFLFCSEFRPKIKGEHPGLSIGDVAKKLGETGARAVGAERCRRCVPPPAQSPASWRPRRFPRCRRSSRASSIICEPRRSWTSASRWWRITAVCMQCKQG